MATAVAVVLCGLVLTAFSDAEEASAEGRELAAGFAGCDPAALTFIDRRAYKTAEGEERVEESYTAGLPESEEARRVWIGVDTVRGLVVRANWALRVPEDAAARSPVSAEEAEAVARAFVGDKCPYYAATDKMRVRVAREDTQVQSYSFEFTGPGPEGDSHWVQARVDAVCGAISTYGLAVLPPEPPPTSPVKVTEAKARSLALARAKPLGITIQKLTLDGLHTRSVFGPPGVPVYILWVDGLRDLPGEPGRKAGYCEQWAVHATTGQVLTEPTHLPPGPPPPPKR